MPTHQYFINSSSVSKISRKPDTLVETCNKEVANGYSNQRGTEINPFNVHPRIHRDNSSLFGKSPMSHRLNKEEEDFEIKPHQIYG